MKLVFIYGPPGVGKLTVANELSKITKYPVFHNHIAIDLVKSVYGYGNRTAEDLIRAINLAAIKTMAMENSDLIFTYSRPNDNAFIKEAVKSVEERGGKTLFVRLVCDKDVLQKRLSLRSYSEYTKISDKKSFAEFEMEHGPFIEIKIRRGITIDTNKENPKDAARSISKRMRLSR